MFKNTMSFITIAISLFSFYSQKSEGSTEKGVGRSNGTIESGAPINSFSYRPNTAFMASISLFE
jgi:hypothetical protein